MAATAVPELPAETKLLEGADEPQDAHIPKLTVRQRQGKLFKELDLSGLESWPPELADSAWWLLAKYHDVFTFEPTELGCTNSTKHVIKVKDDTPLRNNSGRFPHLRWKRFVTICRRCWMQSPYDPVRVHGVTQLCWSERGMEAYASVLISATLMPIQKRIPTPCQEFRKH